MKPVTLVVTSCKRFDLLERTLRSFYATNDYPLARTLVIEDSDDRGVYDVTARFKQARIDVIVNGTNLGQVRSIDKAYATVDTEYIFHTEDDWLFERPGLLRESLAILESDPRILMVMARRQQDMPYYFTSVPLHETGSARYRNIGPKVHSVWFTFSFNPGLRRLSDYRLIPGGYSALGSEAAISMYYKKSGRSLAWLIDAGVTHLGTARSNFNKTRPPLRRVIWNKHVVKAVQSTRRRLGHYSRLLGLSDGF